MNTKQRDLYFKIKNCPDERGISIVDLSTLYDVPNAFCDVDSLHADMRVLLEMGVIHFGNEPYSHLYVVKPGYIEMNCPYCESIQLCSSALVILSYAKYECSFCEHIFHVTTAKV